MGKKLISGVQVTHHIVLYILLSVGLTSIFVFLAPNERGFFCDDITIMYPYKPDTVTITILFGAGFLLPIALIVIAEVIRILTSDKKSKMNAIAKPFSSGYMPFYVRCYLFVGLFLFGGSVQFITVLILKYSVGRLRPSFLDVCKPNWTEIVCEDERGYPRYILEDVCTQTDKHIISDARQSFPSGHASWGAFVSVYMMLYIQTRFCWKPLKFIRYCLQLAFGWAGLFCGISRISDNRHHASDVALGFIIGICFAVYIFSYSGFLQVPCQRLITKQLRSIYLEILNMNYTRAGAALSERVDYARTGRPNVPEITDVSLPLYWQQDVV